MSQPDNWMELRKRGVRSAGELLDVCGISRPPVDVVELAVRIGVELRYVYKPGWSGAIQIVGDRPFIWVDASNHPLRRRFTIAHEIGHLFLHGDRLLHQPTLVFRDEKFDDNEDERAATQFAAELLMPEEWIRSRSLFTHTEELARAFEVSTSAMSFRLATI